MNTAEYLINKIYELGVTDFFCLPGEYNLDFLNSIIINPHTKLINCTNSSNAAFAADGYARQKGFGTVITSYGASELDAISAIAGSLAENIPVINIVGIPPFDSCTCQGNNKNNGIYKYFEIYKNVIETAAFLNKDNAKIEIDRVLKILVKERKPVYIAIPENIAKLQISDKQTDYDWISSPEELSTAVSLITDIINKSKNPIIIADSTIKNFDSKSEFVEFVNKSGIPVVNFFNNSDIINSDNQYYAGIYLLAPENLQTINLVENSDCIIIVGSRSNNPNSVDDSVFNRFYAEKFTNTKFNPNTAAKIKICGNHTFIEGKIYDNIKMSDILSELTKKINHNNYEFEKPKIGYEPITPTKVKLTSDYIYSRLQEFLKGEDIVIANGGTVPFGIARMRFPENIAIHLQHNWQSAGWAVPAAFGAAIANPKARVILITGDGAHQASALEIGNICKFGLKPIIVVINNSGYSYNRLINASDDKQYNDIMQMDYAKFARTFKYDIWATRVETDEDFDKALRITQIMDKLCYIEAVIDKYDIPTILKELCNNNNNTGISSNNSYKELNSETGEDNFSYTSDNNYETSVHLSLKKYEE